MQLYNTHRDVQTQREAFFQRRCLDPTAAVEKVLQFTQTRYPDINPRRTGRGNNDVNLGYDLMDHMIDHMHQRRAIHAMTVTGHVVLLLLALASLDSARLRAFDQCPCTADRLRDEVWIVSTRWLPCGVDGPIADKLQYRRFQQGQWEDSTREAFFAATESDMTTSDMTTVVFVHGNRIDSCEANRLAEIGYHAVAQCAPANKPLRFVLWSWPSSRIGHHQLDDIRTKANRTGPEAHHLAKFLNELHPQSPVSLVGYSFGARIITGALHLLGGGQINGRELKGRDASDHLPLRAVLMAAALDNHWLLPGHAHGLAMPQVDRMLLVTNGCDRALEHYHWLYCRRSTADALGFTGIPSISQLGSDRQKVSQFDACCVIGRSHDWTLYFDSPAIVNRICSIAFEQPDLAPTTSPDRACEP